MEGVTRNDLVVILTRDVKRVNVYRVTLHHFTVDL